MVKIGEVQKTLTIPDNCELGRKAQETEQISLN